MTRGEASSGAYRRGQRRHKRDESVNYSDNFDKDGETLPGSKSDKAEDLSTPRRDGSVLTERWGR